MYASTLVPRPYMTLPALLSGAGGMFMERKVPIQLTQCWFPGLFISMQKYKYIFQIKYTEAILSNNTRKLLWFEITKMLIAVLKISSSSSSFYLPNNTTVYTFAWIRFRRAGQQGPIRTLTAALKRSIKTVTGCIYYHTNKIITNEKD